MVIGSRRFWIVGAAVAALGLVILIFFLSYSTIHAQVSTMANPTCVACVAEAIARKVPPQPYCKPRVCVDTTNGNTTGHCEMTECHGDKFSGAGGSGATGLDQVAKILGDLMSKLMQGKPPSGGSPPSSTPPPSTPGTSGCTQTVAVSDIAQLQGNPCAQYVPPGSNSLTTNGSDQLSGALGGQSGVDLSSAILGNLNSNTNTNGTAADLSTSILTTSSTIPVPQGVAGLAPTMSGGVSGDIRLLTGGATIVAGSQDMQNNKAVAGFYGSESFGGQPQGLVGQWCESRPWAGNFLSFIIPPAFFDSLCTWRGYQVGTPPPPQQSPSLQQTTVKASGASTSAATPASTGPAVPPKVDIWAVPAAVPLGARTTIFWNTQGVTNCTETSPDGSFNQNSLSGGAATVSIAGATTFSISCDAPDGSHVTGYVVVNLAI